MKNHLRLLLRQTVLWGVMACSITAAMGQSGAITKTTMSAGERRFVEGMTRNRFHQGLTNVNGVQYHVATIAKSRSPGESTRLTSTSTANLVIPKSDTQTRAVNLVVDLGHSPVRIEFDRHQSGVTFSSVIDRTGHSFASFRGETNLWVGNVVLESSRVKEVNIISHTDHLTIQPRTSR